MENDPCWECNRFLGSQEFPHVLWNPNVHYRIHTCPPPVPILRQIDPVHTPTSHFLKIHLNIILPSNPGSSKWSFTLRFPHRNPVYASVLPRYVLHAPPISSLFDHPNNIDVLNVFLTVHHDLSYVLITILMHKFSLFIQGVPEGMCQTSGGCSLC